MKRKLKELPNGWFFRVINDTENRIFWKQYYDIGTDSVFAASYDEQGMFRVHRLPSNLEVYRV